MKILVVSNLYPPYYLGGYELGCRDVVDGLRSAGHDIQVLTSLYGVDAPVVDGHVYRWLRSDYEPLNQGRDPAERIAELMQKELQNRRAFKQVCASFTPDLIYFWNLKHISVSLALLAERQGYPVCYYVSDHWLSTWEQDSWYALHHRRPGRFSRRVLWSVIRFFLRKTGLLSEASLQLRHVQFTSRFMADFTQRAGKQVQTAEVIHWGVDTRAYHDVSHSRNAKRLLYVGQLTPEKGVQTAVDALHIVKQHPGCEDATLTIAGGPDYGNQVHSRVAALGLERDVTMTGLIPRERLPELYREHGTLLFPSVWDEPFSITLLEAMASGMAVVGTLTGGSPELLTNGENGLVFAKGDAPGCADMVIRLVQDRALFERIRHNARRSVESRHTIEDMVRKVDESLGRVASSQ